MESHRGFVRTAGLLILALGIATAALAQETEQPQPAPPELLIQEGTTLPIVLTTFLNTRSTQTGDTFYADTTYPIWIQQRLVIPRGSIVKGTVTHVQRPGKIKGKGQIAVRFENILLPNGVSRDLVAELHGLHGPGAEKIDRQTETVEMDSSKGRDAAEVAGPASQGAIIGAIAGGGKGAGIGAGAGGAVGLATVLFSRGRELVLEPGTQFDIVLRKPLRFAYGEVDFSADRMIGARELNRPRPRYNRDDEKGRRFSFPWPF